MEQSLLTQIHFITKYQVSHVILIYLFSLKVENRVAVWAQNGSKCIGCSPARWCGYSSCGSLPLRSVGQHITSPGKEENDGFY